MNRYISLFVALCLAVALTSCGAGRKAVAGQEATASVTGATKVPYRVAQNYFLRNDAGLTGNFVVETQQQFDRLFGAAAVMGKDGMPTKIDFSRERVLVVVKPLTARLSELEPLGLEQAGGGTLTLSYSYRQGKEQSYTMQPVMIVVIDKKHGGEVRFEQK